jgi:hypothetical protein
MINEKVKQLYQAGSVVYAKPNPSVKLSVLRYSKGIYYCAVIGDAQKDNLTFLETQLASD